jgi:hypothetical protein
MPLSISVAMALSAMLMTARAAADPLSEPASPAEGQEDQVFVEVVKAPVFWRTRRDDNEGKELLPKSPTDKSQYRLPAGRSWVRCGRGGTVRIYRLDQAREYSEEAWLAIPALSKAEKALPARDRLFRIAGRLRSSDTRVVLWPADEHVVRPEKLILLWAPQPDRSQVMVEVRPATGGRKLWSKDGIDGKSGRCDDPQLRTSLVRWRAIFGGVKAPDPMTAVPPAADRLILSFKATSLSSPAEIAFDVLTADAEKVLEADLHAWNQSQGYMRHLGRSAVFFRFGLLADAAEEAELALKMAPENRLVRQNAIEAARLLGNRIRVTELEAQQKMP